MPRALFKSSRSSSRHDWTEPPHEIDPESAFRRAPHRCTRLLLFAGLGNAPAFIALLAFSLASDGVDGWWARNCDAASPLGAKLDSWGDLATYSVLPLSVWWLWPGLVLGRSASLLFLSPPNELSHVGREVLFGGYGRSTIRSLGGWAGLAVLLAAKAGGAARIRTMKRKEISFMIELIAHLKLSADCMAPRSLRETYPRHEFRPPYCPAETKPCRRANHW